MIDASRVHAPGSGPNVRVMKMNTENSTMVLSDDEGSIEITTKEGQKHLVAKDAKGNPICEGPITTLREQAAIPAGVLERLKKLEGMQDFQFKTGEEFKGGEVKVITPPARKISLPREASPARRTEAF